MRRYLAEGMSAAQAAESALSTRLSMRAGAGGTIPGGEAETARGQLREALAGFDEADADALLHGVLARRGITAVLREVVVPVAAAAGDGSTAVTHFTAAFLQSRLAALAGGWSRGLGPRAVFSAAPGDHHTLGLLCCGLALRQLGWRVIYLGGAAPLAAVEDAVSATAAQLVVVSCALAGGLDTSADALATIGQSAHLALGGPGVSPGLADACGATWLEDPVAGAVTIALQPSMPIHG